MSAASRDGALYLSSITAWEIGTLVRKKRLVLETSPKAFIQWLFQHSGVCELPIDREIAVIAGTLTGEFHGDPADRLIVATAIIHGLPLMTRDSRILSYAEQTQAFPAMSC